MTAHTVSFELPTDHAPPGPLVTASVPLKSLVAWKGNVRKTASDTQVEELVASIAAHGLLQPLVVRAAGKKFEIVAGRRRFLALTLLLSREQLAPDYAVPCQVIGRDVDPAEISLVENVVRVAMHPADQYEAFSKLADAMTPAAIASRFGVSELTVNRRLALGRVSPRLIEAYRNEEMDLDELSAFTVTDNQAEQERVWAAMKDSYNQSAHAIRRLLTDTDVPTTDKRVRFVTLSSYEAAGGVVRRDLFSEGEDGGYVSSVPLLNVLVQQKLDEAEFEICQEGWKWVKGRVDFDYDTRSQFHTLKPVPVPLTSEQDAELTRLREDYEALATSDAADTWERQNEIEIRIEELTANGQFTAEQRKLSGVVVTLTHEGELSVHRGLVRPEDASAAASAARAAAPAQKRAGGVPASLVESLTAHKTAVIAAGLLERPDVALAATVHAMLLSTLLMRADFYRNDSCIRISATTSSLKFAEGSRAYRALQKAEQKWMKRLPQTADALWPWCLKQKQDTLLDLLAFVAGRCADGVQQKHDRADDSRLLCANALAEALDIDMAAAFRPTSANFFARVGRPAILAAYTEATGNPPPPSWHSMKKAELAAAAERDIGERTDWLPQPVRIGPVAAEEEASSVESNQDGGGDDA